MLATPERRSLAFAWRPLWAALPSAVSEATTPSAVVPSSPRSSGSSADGIWGSGSFGVTGSSRSAEGPWGGGRSKLPVVAGEDAAGRGLPRPGQGTRGVDHPGIGAEAEQQPFQPRSGGDGEG